MSEDKEVNVPAATHCERTVELGAYLMGGLSEHEAHELRVHIDTCTWCSVELFELQPVADLLDSTELASAIIGERLDPTPDMAARLFARAAQESGPGPASPRPPESTTNAGTSFSRPARTRVRRRTIVAAGAAVFALGIGSTLGTQQLVANDKPSRTEQSRDETPKNLERIAFQRISMAVPLPSATPPKAWASIDQTPAGTYAYLYVRDFEVGKVYKWWFVKRDGTKVPLGSFRYPGQVEGEEWLRCPGHTSLERSELIAIGATNEAGVDIVREDLPPAPKVIAT